MSTYDQVLSVGKQYLGAAAEKFIERQCKNLKVEPAKLTPADMEQLAWFTKNAAGLYMDDAKATQLSQRIAALK